jgi:preprotein translocase subunit SecB
MNPISPLQLKDYFIESLHVDANPSFSKDTTTSYPSALALSFDFKKRGDAPVFRIDLEVNVNPTEETFKEAPYRIRVKTQTFFECDPKISEEETSKLLGPNGLAMAYSIIRGIIGQATGTSLHGKFVLPTVNFIALLEEKARASKLSKHKREAKASH